MALFARLALSTDRIRSWLRSVVEKQGAMTAMDPALSRRNAGALRHTPSELRAGGHVMDVAAESLAIVVALKRFSKRFAEGRGGLSHQELVHAT